MYLLRVRRNGLNQQISAVIHQLAVNTKDRPERAVNLPGRVIARLQPPHGSVNQLAQHRDVTGDGRPDCKDGRKHLSEVNSTQKTKTALAGRFCKLFFLFASFFYRHGGQVALYLFGMRAAGLKLKIFVAGGFGVVKFLRIEFHAA